MTTPSTAVGGMWKSRPIVGSATLTIVMSMMFMNMADTKTVPTTIFWFIRTTATSLFLLDASWCRPCVVTRERTALSYGLRSTLCARPHVSVRGSGAGRTP